MYIPPQHHPLPHPQPLPTFKGIMNNNNNNNTNNNNNLDPLRAVQSTYYDHQNLASANPAAYNGQASSNYHINPVPSSFFDNSNSEVFDQRYRYQPSNQLPLLSQPASQQPLPPPHQQSQLPSQSQHISQKLNTPSNPSTSPINQHQQPSLPKPSNFSPTDPTSTRVMKKKPPKAKFTAEDDDLLVDLKEVRKLTWKQIAEHFDGRTAGALQVRYCTKLKARSIDWSDEDVEALHEAMKDYEDERWIVVSQKMGSKFTASVCREKYNEIKGL